MGDLELAGVCLRNSQLLGEIHFLHLVRRESSCQGRKGKGRDQPRILRTLLPLVGMSRDIIMILGKDKIDKDHLQELLFVRPIAHLCLH